MLAVKSVDARMNFREWYNKAIGGETVVVSSPADGNVIMMSEQEYNEMAKAKRNAEYLEELDRRSRRLANGEGIHKTLEELEVMENE